MEDLVKILLLFMRFTLKDCSALMKPLYPLSLLLSITSAIFVVDAAVLVGSLRTLAVPAVTSAAVYA